MGRTGLNPKATETIGMGTSTIAMAIREDECVKKN